MQFSEVSDIKMAKILFRGLTISCFSEIQIGFTFLVLAHPGSPRKRAVKRVCVCVLIDGKKINGIIF